MGSCTVSLNFESDNYFLCDANADLVNFFSTITTNDKDYLLTLANGYFTAEYESYYTIRDLFNNEPVWSVKRAAMFLYLNKFGFNGLCRYNKSGKFNVPIGKSASPVRLPKQLIHTCSDKLKFASFNNYDFRQTFKLTESINDDLGVLIYCDSPYVPLTTEFNYTADWFKEQDHVDLKDLSKSSKHTVILSNHLTDFTKELYKDADEVYTVDVQRTISCSGSERKKVQEMIVVYKGEK
jgi:DNA adenine methylase